MPADAKPSLLDRVKAMGQELGLEGEEFEKYVDQHMQKAGWKRTFDYSPPDGKTDGGNQKEGWF